MKPLKTHDIGVRVIIMQKILRNIASAIFALSIFVGPSAVGEPSGVATTAPEIREDDVFYGKADAKVVIVEYASLTCPHCANFHKTILPELKSGPLADGRARLVFRDFPLDGLALRAAALSRCGGPSRRLAILDLLFESQGVWARSPEPLKALSKIGQLAGLKEETSMACMEDKGMLERIIAEAQEGEQKHGVQSTPSFVIDETLYRGGITAKDIIKVIDTLAN
jgi:protein-disulfide isomerase